MPLTIIRNDITKVKADAIVNSANPLPIYVSGTDRAIYQAAGAEELLREREKIGKIEPGTAAATPAFRLPANYIIHTVGPMWFGGEEGELNTLSSCYTESLRLAKKLKCKSIAFPLISTGVYGFPKDKALNVALSAISTFLMESEMKVSLVVFDAESFVVSGRVFEDVEEIVRDSYVNVRARYEYDRLVFPVGSPSGAPSEKHAEESFSGRLFQIMNERNLKYSTVYKKANMNRQHFSKINCNADYIPKKSTVIALCIALELDIIDAEDLMMRAGYAFSPAIPFDRIAKNFIVSGEHNIWELNAALAANNLPQLVPKEG